MKYWNGKCTFLTIWMQITLFEPAKDKNTRYILHACRDG